MGIPARQTDPFTDGDAVASGSPDVLMDNLPVARKGDPTTGHDGWPPSVIIQGNSGILVNNKPIAEVGDKHAVHCKGDSCHDGAISAGSGTVST